METVKQKTIFLTLVPHRDTRLVLRNYSVELFKAGFSGAFDFPWVVPLAVISRPFSSRRLKNFAHTLRQINADKFSSTEAASVVLPPNENGMALFGPRLDISAALNSGCGASGEIFLPQTIIGCCLLNTCEAKNTRLPQPPKLSFRAAAAANMIRQPLAFTSGSVTGYKWKIGELFWLPKNGE